MKVVPMKEVLVEFGPGPAADALVRDGNDGDGGRGNGRREAVLPVGPDGARFVVDWRALPARVTLSAEDVTLYREILDLPAITATEVRRARNRVALAGKLGEAERMRAIQNEERINEIAARNLAAIMRAFTRTPFSKDMVEAIGGAVEAFARKAGISAEETLHRLSRYSILTASMGVCLGTAEDADPLRRLLENLEDARAAAARDRDRDAAAGAALRLAASDLARMQALATRARRLMDLPSSSLTRYDDVARFLEDAEEEIVRAAGRWWSAVRYLGSPEFRGGGWALLKNYIPEVGDLTRR